MPLGFHNTSLHYTILKTSPLLEASISSHYTDFMPTPALSLRICSHTSLIYLLACSNRPINTEHEA